MAMSDDDATKRGKALEAVNVALADIATAQKRVDEAAAKHRKFLNNMKSEMGTAGTELRKCKTVYGKAREKLLALMPEPSPPEEKPKAPDFSHIRPMDMQ